MTKAEGYSLWLMPTDDVYRQLSETISQLSSKYSAPYFEPHVTLLGELLESEEEMLSKTEQLAGLIKPFTIKLTHVDYLDQYFRCLFLRADETNDLINANNKAREVFNRGQDSTFMPHLSLMYGDFTPKIKQQIIGDVGRDFDISFEVGNIRFCLTDGEPKDWYRVQEFALK